ncbi:hypothetical protein GCM10010922_14290 [Microbacterium sorbitolivorans]|nr:hypothetical protein GCM10010922_14290 [Microbacterium sorbitolivorans]
MGASALLAIVLVTAVVPQAAAASEESESWTVVETSTPSPAPEDPPVAAESADPMPEASTSPLQEFSTIPAVPEDLQPTPSAEPSEAPEEAADDAQASEQAPQDEPGVVAPLSVPAPSSTTAVINVKVRGDRTAGGPAALAGVELQLYNGTSAPTTARSEAWATCVSDAQGDCSFTVPNTQCRSSFGGLCWDAAANRDRRFWVMATSAPADWYLNSPLVVGTGSTSTYAFRTGENLRAGNTYTSGSAFMANNDSRTSTGLWQASRVNPTLPLRCEAGLSVALILDLSGSVDNYVGTLKDAAKGMVDSLAGSGSSVALFTFAASAPRNSNGDGRNWGSLAIDQGNNLDTIKNRIDAYATGGATNWDRGIWQVAASSTDFDLAIMVTDGMPTYSGSPASGPGDSTQFAQVEQAIFSANALKAEGTRVLAVGVGDGLSGDPANLRAVSGTVGHVTGQSGVASDYFQTPWSELTTVLSSIAKGATCQATIDIEKQTKAYGTNEYANGGSGWTFSASSTQGTLSTPAEQTTGSEGSASWTVKFGTPHPQTPAAVSLSEILGDHANSGWSLDSIACTLNGKAVSVLKPTATVNVTSGDALKCTFNNVQTLVPDIDVVKTAWLGDVEIDDGDEVASGTSVTWKYLVTNTGQTALTDIAVADDQVGNATCPKTELAVGESMTCSATGSVTAQE